MSDQCDASMMKDGELSPDGSTDGQASGSNRAKPPFSYAQLIVQAIASNSDHQLTLSGIYAYISRLYPYYRINDKGWQVNLLLILYLITRDYHYIPRSQTNNKLQLPSRSAILNGGNFITRLIFKNLTFSCASTILMLTLVFTYS